MTLGSATMSHQQKDKLPKPWKPHDYQVKSVEFLLSHGGAGLFLDPGLGKTSVVLKAFQVLKSEGIGKRMLVIAPLRVIHNVWPEEAKKWTDFHDLRIAVLHGKDKEWLWQHDYDIYLINPDGLDWLIKNDILRKLQIDTLVVDESSKFKNTQTKRFKLLKAYIPRFSRRWILTGTPTPNGYLDLFGQMYIVDMGRALGQYITHFRFNYFTPTGYGGYTWVLKPESAVAIQERIKPTTLRLEAGDYLKLPKRIEKFIEVELPEKARKMYDEMEEDMLLKLDDITVVGTNAAAVSTKCRQIASGGLYHTPTPDDDMPVMDLALQKKREVIQIHDAKTDALVDLVDDLQGAQIMVGYQYDHDLDRITMALKDRMAHISGGVSPKKSKEIQDRWNRGDLQVLVAHPAAMGHGLNLQESSCSHVVWYSGTYNFEDYDQFIKRVERQGNESEHVFVYHIVAKDTVDKAIIKAIHKKDKTQKGFLDALKEYKEEVQSAD